METRIVFVFLVKRCSLEKLMTTVLSKDSKEVDYNQSALQSMLELAQVELK